MNYLELYIRPFFYIMRSLLYLFKASILVTDGQVTAEKVVSDTLYFLLKYSPMVIGCTTVCTTTTTSLHYNNVHNYEMFRL